jgi:hypothetical protein
MLSHIYMMINMGYLAIPEKYEKLILSLRTAHAKEYSLDKEQTSYDDLLNFEIESKGLHYNLNYVEFKLFYNLFTFTR